MNTDVVSQFGVETGAHDVALSDSNDVVELAAVDLVGVVHRAPLYLVLPVWQYSQDLNLCLLWISITNRNSGLHRIHSRAGCQQLLDNGRPDEDAGKRGRGIRARKQVRLCQERQIDVCHEALDLTAKVVAVHLDVQAAYKLLPTLLGGVRCLSEEDETCACAPGGLLSGSEAPSVRTGVPGPGEWERGWLTWATHLTKSLSGPMSPDCAAMRAMVVLSPPGIMRASHRARS